MWWERPACQDSKYTKNLSSAAYYIHDDITSNASFTHKTFHLFQVYLSPSQQRWNVTKFTAEFQVWPQNKTLRKNFLVYFSWSHDFWSTHLWLLRKWTINPVKNLGFFFFQDSETTMCATINMSSCICATPRDIQHQGWPSRKPQSMSEDDDVSMSAQVMLTNVPLWAGSWTVEEIEHVLGKWAYGKSLYLLLTIAGNLKPL